MADASEVDRNSSGEPHEHPDLTTRRLAERQHGVVARRQLETAGLSRDVIDHRVRTGRLTCLYRGVYATGHDRLSAQASWMAGVLAAGPGAVLSHRSAAALWGIRPWRGKVDVTIPGSRGRREGIVWHVSRLPDDEVTTVDGIRVTSVPRTLLDLAAVLDRLQLERAVNQAEVLRLTDSHSLPSLIQRHPRRKGVPTLRRIVGAGVGGGVTRIGLEERFLRFLDLHGLPRPELNAPIHLGDRFVEVDCLWRAQRLIVELDSRTFHDTALAFEQDRTRDRALAAAGWRVARVTWRQLGDHPAQLAADLRTLLAVPV